MRTSFLFLVTISLFMSQSNGSIPSASGAVQSPKLRGDDGLVVSGPIYSEPREFSPFIHLVQPGESVASLSKMYRVNQRGILDANPRVKVKALKPGTQLIIPE